MANHSIKITGVADFSGIERDIDELNSHIKEAFGKTGAKVIDPKTVSHLKKETHELFSGMDKELKKLKKEALELNKALKNNKAGDKESATLSTKIHENTKKTLDLKQRMRGVASQSNRLAQYENGGNVIPFPNKKQGASFGKVAGSTLMAGASEIAGAVPGASEGLAVGSSAMQAGSAAAGAGLSTAAVLGLGALAAAAAVAAVAVSRMSAGFEAYKAVTDKILTLNGMGVTPMKAGSRGADLGAKLGYDNPTVLGTQIGLNKSFGNAGSTTNDENRLGNVLTASRALGLGPSEITSGGNQLRQAGGTETAQKQMAMILEKALTSGMDKSQASAYLSASVGLLSELNQNGVTSGAALLSTMTGLVSKNGLSPEQAAKSLGGLNSAISNSSGESNAFFQSAAARANLGGGTIMGSQFAVRQGLTGVDMGSLQKGFGDTAGGRMGIQGIKDMGLDSNDFTKKFAKSISDEIKSRFSTNTKEGRLGAMGFTNQMFGGKTAGDAAKTMALLDKIADSGSQGLSDADKKSLQNLTQDPESAWRDNTLKSLDRTAAATEIVAAWSANAKINLGEKSAPIFNTLTDIMTKLDNKLAGGVQAATQDASDYSLSNIKDTFNGIIMTFAEAGTNFVKTVGDGIDEWWSTSLMGKAFDSLFGSSDKGMGSMDIAAKAGEWAGNAKDKVTDFLGMTDHASEKDDKAHQEEHLNEVKKTNKLLERMANTSSFKMPPNAGRELSRQHK